MNKYEVSIVVSRIYHVVIEAPDEDIAESVGWSLDTLDLHHKGSLEDVEIDHVTVLWPAPEYDAIPYASTDTRIPFGDVVYAGDVKRNGVWQEDENA